jgi:hypothetical protein
MNLCASKNVGGGSSILACVRTVAPAADGKNIFRRVGNIAAVFAASHDE